jgi:hypothetical protein
VKGRIAFAVSVLAIGGFLLLRPASSPTRARNQCGPGAELSLSDEPEIHVLFGYKDARPARFVGDRYERTSMAEALTKPCVGERRDCGFVRSAEDEELFSKEMRDAHGKSRWIRLRLAGSAASADDEENRRDPFQAWKTRRAARLFHEGLRSADAVFYDGHSRDGGGPDFAPPRLRADRHVDYGWYLAKRPGMRALERALAGAPRPARVVGLYSCDSNRLTVTGAAAKKVRWITYDKLYYFADAMNDIRDSISGLLTCARP